MTRTLFIALALCGALLTTDAFAIPPQTQRRTRLSSTRSTSKSSKTVAPKSPVKNDRLPAASVMEIDTAKLKELVMRDTTNPRPLLVNFWATWCEPCREEFPDLVKIDNELHSRGLDFILVSADDIGEIKTTVPQFLTEMRATRIPSYLLNPPDAEGAINAVNPSSTDAFALPATFLFNRRGELVYKHTGRIKPAELKAEINKVLIVNGK